MKWVTHQTVGAGMAYVMGLPLLAVGAAWFGSIAPDVLDQKLAKLVPGDRKTAFYKVHRRTTHWLGWWIAIWIAAFAVPDLDKAIEGLPELPLLVAGLGFGGVSHILLDMCTPSGVPLKPFSYSPRFSLKLCKTGSLGEYLFLAASVALMAFLKYEEVQPIVDYAVTRAHTIF